VLVDPARRAAAQAMIREAMPWTADGRPDWPRVEALEREYANVDVRTTVVYGARDETLGAVTGWKIASQVPGARLRLVTHSMHMLPSEQPVVLADLVRAFADGDPSSEPRFAWVDGTD
jgi:pimeloyl-ACP methyl ester carboxylesterase